MTNQNEYLVKEIVGSIRRLVRAVYLDSSKMSRRYGLTSAQTGILNQLYGHGPLSSAELSRKLHVTPSNITGVIDRLEKKGLVERIRKEGDRRVALIRLTDEGGRMGSQLPDPIELKLISELADLESEEVRRLGQSLDRLLHLIDATGVEPELIEVTTIPASVEH